SASRCRASASRSRGCSGSPGGSLTSPRTTLGAPMSSSPSRVPMPGHDCRSSRPASPSCPSIPVGRPTTATPTAGRSSWASSPGTSMPPDIEAIAEQVFSALSDPTRRAILATLAAQGPATATDLADRLPITRQAIATHLVLLTDADLVIPEQGERRRVRYRLHSAPVRVAQQFLAALAHQWADRLEALREHLDTSARVPGTPTRTSALNRKDVSR